MNNFKSTYELKDILKNLKSLKISLILSIFILMILQISVCLVFANSSAQQKTYSIGYQDDLYPLEYTSDGEVCGIIVDITKEIIENIGSEYKFIEIGPNSSDELINSLDLIISMDKISESYGGSFSENRISENCYTLPLYLFGIRDISENIDMSIGIYNYLSFEEDTILSLIPNATIKTYNSFPDMEKALVDNEINFIFSTSTNGQTVLRKDVHKRFQSYPVSIPQNINISVSNYLSNAELEMINKSIENLDKSLVHQIVLENTYDTSYDTIFAMRNQLYEFHHVIITVTIVTAFILAICLTGLIWYKKSKEKLLFYDQLTDFLTGYKFSIEAKKLLTKGGNGKYSLMSIDVDNFKYINECYGFKTGNYIIKKFSLYLKEIYPEAILFGRTHSDNFAVLFYSKDESKFSQPMDKVKLLKNFENDLNGSYQINTSKGIYNIIDNKETPSVILNCANLAKNLGKSTYGHTSVVFDDEMNKTRNLFNYIISNMEKALDNKEFIVYYQPKVDLTSKTVSGGEALIRWIEQLDNTFIFPDEFIPVFEKNRYITKLDFYVFEETCHYISLNSKILKNKSISVNLSTITLLIPDLPEQLETILRKYNIGTDYIELEVTESAFTDNLELISHQIDKLRNIGFKIALDDFGSGISSLNQLENIYVDVIKLDKGFLSSSLNNKRGYVIVENVIQLSKKLGLKIVAEGVETKDLVDKLDKLGCDIIQGYYFAKPMSDLDFTNYINNFSKDMFN